MKRIRRFLDRLVSSAVHDREEREERESGKAWWRQLLNA